MHVFRAGVLPSDNGANANMQDDMRTYRNMLKQLVVHSQDTTAANCGSALLSGKSSSVKKVNLDRLRPLFCMGERVLVKAGPVLKVSSPYHGPYMVEEILDRYTFRLCDGQHWSARVMKCWWEPWMDDEENINMPEEGNCEEAREGTAQSHAKVPESPGRLLPICSAQKNTGIPPERWSYPAPV